MYPPFSDEDPHSQIAEARRTTLTSVLKWFNEAALPVQVQKQNVKEAKTEQQRPQSKPFDSVITPIKLSAADKEKASLKSTIMKKKLDKMW